LSLVIGLGFFICHGRSFTPRTTGLSFPSFRSFGKFFRALSARPHQRRAHPLLHTRSKIFFSRDFASPHSTHQAGLTSPGCRDDLTRQGPGTCDRLAASFYEKDSLEVTDIKFRIDPLRFWLVTLKKARGRLGIYAVLLRDGQSWKRKTERV
jgi:hypothetical protein